MSHVGLQIIVFLGKRSRLSAAATRHVTSVFGRLVSEAGVGLSLGDGPNTISETLSLYTSMCINLGCRR